MILVSITLAPYIPAIELQRVIGRIDVQFGHSCTKPNMLRFQIENLGLGIFCLRFIFYASHIAQETNVNVRNMHCPINTDIYWYIHPSAGRVKRSPCSMAIVYYRYYTQDLRVQLGVVDFMKMGSTSSLGHFRIDISHLCPIQYWQLISMEYTLHYEDNKFGERLHPHA